MSSPDFETVKRGQKFLYGNMWISVSQVFRLEKSFDVQTERLLDHLTGHWLVEITAISTQDRASDMGQEIQAFAAYLVGLVEMVQVDHKKLQQR